MKRLRIFLIPLLALILSACSGASVPLASVPTSAEENTPAKQTNVLIRKDNQGAVVVTVNPINLNNPGETLDFSIALETHSVELDMDLPTLSALTTDTGVTVLGATWDGSRGGHHVEGTLSFPASQDGKSVLQDAEVLTLLIQNVDAPERIFNWDILP